MRVLMPIPNIDFDPTIAVPWKTLSNAGVEVVVATPDGAAEADLIAGSHGRSWLAYPFSGRNPHASIYGSLCTAIRMCEKRIQV